MSDDHQRGPRVLDVGQCAFDHGAIRRVLKEHFDAQVEQAHTIDEAMRMAAGGNYRLVLVNRILDYDGAEGLELVTRLRSDHSTSATPVMLVSDRKDAQARAVERGAVPGVGKSALRHPSFPAMMSSYLT
jgi:PleD family two-component response regulator